MARNPVKSTALTIDNKRQVSRRNFLGALALAPALPLHAAMQDEALDSAKSNAESTTIDREWWSPREHVRSRVVEAYAPNIVRGAVADLHALRDLVSDTVTRLTGETSTERAWKLILGNAERIAIKFNSVGTNVLSTNETLARVLVSRLAFAGYDAKQIALIEVPDYMTAELQTRKPARGWGTALTVGGKPTQLANWLLESDAIINVGFIKTHQIAGMSCTMKNLAYAAIRNPAKYHDRACAPYVPEIITKTEITQRLRLNLANGLQVVIKGGPDADSDSVVTTGGILAGFDPVAVDVMAHQLLMGERRRAGLPDNIEVGYLRESTRLNIGRSRFQDIERFSLAE